MQGDAALTVPVGITLLAVLSFDTALAQLLWFSHEDRKVLNYFVLINIKHYFAMVYSLGYLLNNNVAR